MSSEAREATRGSAIKLGAELLGRVLALVTSLLIARGLGPAAAHQHHLPGAVPAAALPAPAAALHGPH